MGRDRANNDLLPRTVDMLILNLPGLQRLELNGAIEGEWEMTANNRRARFYRLTAAGKKGPESETERYRQVTTASGPARVR